MKRAVLALALVFAPYAAAQSDVTELFPDATAYVVRVHAPALLAQTAFGDSKSLKSAMKDATAFLESCGIDPFRDVTQTTLAIGSNASARTAVVLLEGTFAPAKVKERLTPLTQDKTSGLEARPNGVYQWAMPPDKAPAAGGVTMPSRYYFAVVDGQLAAWSLDEGAINDAIDKRAKRKKGTPSPRVQELLAKANPKQAVAIVAVPPAGSLAKTPAAGLTHVTGGLFATDALKLELTCATKDANAARALAEYVTDGIATIKSFAVLAAAQSKTVSPGQQAMIREFFDTFVASATPTGVAVTSVLSKDFLDKNAKK